jgi:hypothetical protein
MRSGWGALRSLSALFSGMVARSSGYALALASYAKQAEDEELFNNAKRIQVRAVDRIGELLEEIEPNKGGRPVSGDR